MKITRSLSNEKGQAIFEMILFIPFLLFLYTIYYTAGNAISSSIIQQKAVRGYFFISLRNNSYINNNPELIHYQNGGMKRVGFSAFGWADHLGSGREAYGTCFKFSSLLKNGSSEDCNSADRDKEDMSHFIRIFTFFGVCGPNYLIDRNNRFYINPSAQMNGKASCEVSKND